MVGAPGEQPRLHVIVADVVAGFHLPVGLANFGQHPFLVGHIGFDRVGNQEIRAAAGSLGQPRQPFLDLGFEPDAKRSTRCVRHEHIVTRVVGPSEQSALRELGEI